jgi:hypothetical protein
MVGFCSAYLSFMSKCKGTKKGGKVHFLVFFSMFSNFFCLHPRPWARLILCEKISQFGLKLSELCLFCHFGEKMGQKHIFGHISAKISQTRLKMAPNISIRSNIDRKVAKKKLGDPLYKSGPLDME